MPLVAQVPPFPVRVTGQVVHVERQPFQAVWRRSSMLKATEMKDCLPKAARDRGEHSDEHPLADLSAHE